MKTATAIPCAFLAAALFVGPAAAAPSSTSAHPSVALATWSPIQWAFGTQRRMLQVTTVGMCLALYIIMWRK